MSMPVRGLVALLLAGIAVPAFAQGDLPARVDRIEKELHAVQRKVFPGGNPDYFEPQITAPAAAPVTEGNPATSAVGDLTARVNALEAQVRDLTNQSEVNSHRLGQLEQAFAKLQADNDDRLTKLENAGQPTAAPAAGTPAPTPAGSPPPFGPSGRRPPGGAARPAPPPADNGAGDTMADQAAATDAPSGVAAASAGAAAHTGDPAEDAYMAGYQLWSEKRYGEAETALKAAVAKYPDSKRASYAQNLLGRAYMDDGQLSAAADAFLTNYKRFPRGERAPDSLYYLGVTLTKLKKQTQACQVYDELRDVYGATLNATLKGRVAQGRVDAKCGA